jgi:hypothetical protein
VVAVALHSHRTSDGAPIYEWTLRAADGREANGSGIGNVDDVAQNLAKAGVPKRVGDLVNGSPIIRITASGTLITERPEDFAVYNPSGWRVGIYKLLKNAEARAERADAEHENPLHRRLR